jgi:uncharacterized protein YqeY
MSLLQKFDDDLKTALKASDKVRLSVLRMVKAAAKNKQIEKQLELSDDEVLEILASLVKQRNESIEQFSKGGREDLAERERQERAVLQLYLPEQLSPEELEGLIRQAIEKASAKSVADLGRVMKILMPRVKGVADGKWINTRVRELLNAPHESLPRD